MRPSSRPPSVTSMAKSKFVAVEDASGIDQPVEVAGPAGREAAEVAGHDLSGALVGQPGLRVGLDRHHRGIPSQVRRLRGRQPQVLRVQRTQGRGAAHRRTGPRGVGRAHRRRRRRPGLHRVAFPVVARPSSSLSAAVSTATARTGAYPPDERGQALHLLGVGRVHHVGVLGLVGHDAAAVSRTRSSQASFGGPANCTRVSASSRSGASLPASERRLLGIESSGRGGDATHVVAAVGAGGRRRSSSAAGGLHQRERLVGRDHARVASRQRCQGLRRVRHHQEMAARVRRLRDSASASVPPVSAAITITEMISEARREAKMRGPFTRCALGG